MGQCLEHFCYGFPSTQRSTSHDFDASLSFAKLADFVYGGVTRSKEAAMNKNQELLKMTEPDMEAKGKGKGNCSPTPEEMLRGALIGQLPLEGMCTVQISQKVKKEGICGSDVSDEDWNHMFGLFGAFDPKNPEAVNDLMQCRCGSDYSLLTCRYALATILAAPQGLNITPEEARAKIATKLEEFCNTVLGLLDKKFIPEAKDAQAAVFYRTIKGDYHSYIAEIQRGQTGSKAATDAKLAYDSAQLAAKDLPETNPIYQYLMYRLTWFYLAIAINIDEATAMFRKIYPDGMGRPPNIPDADPSKIDLSKDNDLLVYAMLYMFLQMVGPMLAKGKGKGATSGGASNAGMVFTAADMADMDRQRKGKGKGTMVDIDIGKEGPPNLPAGVSPEIAAGFIQALVSEYVADRGPMVGVFFGQQQMSEEVSKLLDREEVLVRGAQDCAGAIENLRTRWNY